MRKILTGSDFHRQLKDELRTLMADLNHRVVLIVGPAETGIRKAVLEVCKEEQRQTFEHTYTILETATPFKKAIQDHPKVAHLWTKAFKSNILNSQVFEFLTQLESGTIPFKGIFLILAEDVEFPDGVFPELPLINIELSMDDVVEIASRSITEKIKNE